MWEGSLDEVKERADIRRPGVLPFFVRDVAQVWVIHLKRRVADEYVQPAELSHRRFDERSGVLGMDDTHAK
jgi:hypothetical protein